MIEVPINVCGDHWCNSDDLDEYLAQASDGDEIHLRVNTEGPSLHALGVVEKIEKFCQATGRDVRDIKISGWGNDVEIVPFQRLTRFLYSHFYFMSERYWQDRVSLGLHEHTFGLFIGRATIPRQMITWHMWTGLRDRCMFSVMKHNQANTQRGIMLDRADEWTSVAQYAQVQEWWDSDPIGSLDHKQVRDQYDPEQNTNLDLLAFYDRFDIEIVCETYTRGECFFPTEKTVRPMVGLKPMLVYGPRNFLQRLRDQGFRTWQDHWCEDYDLYEGAERWRHMKQIIDQIAAMTPHQHQPLMESAQVVCQHNRDNLLTLRKNHAPK